MKAHYYYYFLIVQFPNADGIIAPGMSCSYSISFTPDSLADFSDKIKVSIITYSMYMYMHVTMYVTISRF